MAWSDLEDEIERWTAAMNVALFTLQPNVGMCAIIPVLFVSSCLLIKFVIHCYTYFMF